MTFAYIKQRYGIDAAIGDRVRIYDGRLGTIVGSDGARLRVQVDGEKWAGNFHPTWRIEYLRDDSPARERESAEV